MELPVPFAEGVSLASRTTFAVGGAARYLAACNGASELAACLTAARRARVPVALLGGGSNLLVADGGFDGLVLELVGGEAAAILPEVTGEAVRLRVGGGVEWDALVGHTVAHDWAGIEALSGIPGRVGAAPIQNIGAYGQELADVVEAVEVVDAHSGEIRTLPAAACGFGYRKSHFKGRWRGHFAVTAVTLRLRPGGAATVRYPDLLRRLGMAPGGAPPPLADVRRTVLEVRREKSMVLDAASATDPNRRSAGSFFLNPVVTREKVEAVRRAAEELDAGEVPTFPAPAAGAGGSLKLSAAWLIEAAGFERGFEAGAVGLSSAHALALINRGGASAADVVAFARRIRRAVRLCFGVTLHPEPSFLGFAEPVERLLG
jgi:UDP-N-acetylmuramate dehydrogenase